MVVDVVVVVVVKATSSNVYQLSLPQCRCDLEAGMKSLRASLLKHPTNIFYWSILNASVDVATDVGLLRSSPRGRGRPT